MKALWLPMRNGRFYADGTLLQEEVMTASGSHWALSLLLILKK